MKKIIAYIAVVAAFAAVSCTRSEVGFEKMESSRLTISLNPSEMATRASAIPAVEFTVSEFDWFIYPDATGTSTPVYHGHFTVGDSGLTPSGTNTPTTYTVDAQGVYHLGFDLENTFTDLALACNVYVLANYPGIDHGTAANLTLEKLLALEIETNFDEKSKTYETINNFVMDSYSGNDDATYPQLVPVLNAVADPTDKTKANLDVPLRRVAAKITFTLNISEKIEDPQSASSTVKTYWRPLTTSENYAANMVNAISYATVQGDPQKAEDMAPTLINGNSGITGGHQIFYQTTHGMASKDNHEPPLVWELDPFYTYPVEFDTKSNNAPYLKIALPWENVDEEGNLTNKGATLFYYKAYLLDENKKPLTSFNRNTHYVVTVNVDTIGGTQEDYVTLDTFFYIAQWLVPADGTYEGYSAPRFLDIARPVYYIYGDNDLTVAVTSSHNISATITSVSQKTLMGATKLSNSDLPALTGGDSPRAGVTTDGKISFNLFYELDTTLDKADGEMDITPITWTVHVFHTEDPEYFKDVTIYQYPSIYGELDYTDNWESRYVNGEKGVARDGSGDGTQTDVWNNRGNQSGAYGSYTNYLGKVGVYAGKSWNKTILTISTLASMLESLPNFNWKLGDPRGPLSEVYNYGETIHNGTIWYRDDLGESSNYLDDYLIGDPAKGDYIAPRFMVSSSYAADGGNGSVRWKNSAERCAAYQEDGYPAGRWRLPTEAEIEFIINLETSGYLDPNNVIFHPTHSYWSSTGRFYYGATKEFTTPPNNAYPSGVTVSTRCIYDLWYWGDEPYNNQGVQIKEGVTPSTPATIWLGFKTTAQ